MIKRKIVYLFSGQGSHYYQMGQDLMENEPAFRDCMYQLDRAIQREWGYSVVATIFNPKKKISDTFDDLKQTNPAVFMIQYAMTKLLAAYGIEPDLIIGTSMGEYVAAAVAEVLPPREVLHCILSQAELIHRHCEPGGMLSILENAEQVSVQAHLYEGCELVSVNFDGHFTIAGPPENLHRVVQHLEREGTPHQLLMTTAGFHSHMMDPIAAQYCALLDRLSYRLPKYRLISCVTGLPLSSFANVYLWRVCREPIRFHGAVQSLLATGDQYHCVDLGPSGTLATFLKYITRNQAIRSSVIMSPFGKNQKRLHQFVAEVNGTGTPS
ncbi:MAG: acyltransferase domain-containing protein [Desulfobulbus sp.]|nr:acyltransferase domain-containing protein [Desulfobulbus sp.]